MVDETLLSTTKAPAAGVNNDGPHPALHYLSFECGLDLLRFVQMHFFFQILIVFEFVSDTAPLIVLYR